MSQQASNQTQTAAPTLDAAQIQALLGMIASQQGPAPAGAAQFSAGDQAIMAKLGGIETQVGEVRLLAQAAAAVTSNLPAAFVAQAKKLGGQEAEQFAKDAKTALAADRYISLDKGLLGDAAEVVSVAGGAAGLYLAAKHFGLI